MTTARYSRRGAVALAVLFAAAFGLYRPAAAATASYKPEGRVVIAWHVTISPAWFDPSTAPPQITPFGMLYAIHDALVRPYPGYKMGPSLAESWEESEDGLTYTFKLRPGLKFHNGDPLTTEDVKFSFDRYQGAGAKALKEHVKDVEIVDPRVIRFHLTAPWPDFMTFYGTTATAAGIVVPKKYLSEVGPEEFKKHPIGAGPYKFVSAKPGIEVVLEANPDYWRVVPHVKTLVMRSVPDATTRGLMLRSGEADMAYALDGVDAQGIQKDPKLKVVSTKHASIFWIEFTDQWDPKSPWHDRRVRLAANLAIDRAGINQAVYLGLSKLSHSFIPQGMEYYWAPPPYAYDPTRARALLAEAGYPNGFESGDLSGDTIYGVAIGEPVVNYLQQVGIRLRLRPMERAAFFKEYGEKKLRGVIFSGSGAPGNAPTRLEQYAITGGRYAYGAYPDIDGLYTEQANEMNPRVRAQILNKIQQIIHDRAMFGPVIEPAFLNGVGPRVEVHGLGLIANHAYSAPYEDLRLRRP